MNERTRSVPIRSGCSKRDEAAASIRRSAGVTSILFALLKLCGCAAEPGEYARPLPYRLAIVPFTVQSLGAGTAETDPEREEGDVRIQLPPQLAREMLVERLDGGRFAEARMLSFPDEAVLAEFERLPRDQKDQYWIRAARETGANLIMECDLKVSQKVDSWLNEKFWLNLPLFLLGGPASYFVKDRSYYGDARLQFTIHLLDPLVDQRTTLSDGRAQVLRSEVRFNETSLDFLDRTGFSPFPYVASLVIPCGLLVVNSDRVRLALEHAIAEQLSRLLEREIRESSPQIVRADYVSAFYLDPKIHVAEEGSSVQISGEVVLRQGALQRLDAYTIKVGHHSVSYDFGISRIDTGLSTERNVYLRYALVGRLPREDDAGFVEIEMRAGGRDRERRTFCVPLPPRSGKGR
jgi:hypothetical protein